MKRIIALLSALAMVLSMGAFCVAETGENGEIHAEFPFGDVPATRWSNPYVVLMYEKKIVNGKSANVFAPADDIKRAEFVKILCGVAGGDTEGAEHSFTDVEAGSWYEPYVAWAASNGIVNGMTADTFAPDAKISRQDMAVMIYRYVENVLCAEPELPPLLPEPIGPTAPTYILPTETTPPPVIMSDEPPMIVIPTIPEEPEEPELPSGLPVIRPPVTFTDEDVIADYAKEAVYAMQLAGIIGGVMNEDSTFRFEPKNSATREQACKMLGELYLIINEDETLPEPVKPKAYTIKYYPKSGKLSGAPAKYYTGEGTKVPNPTKAGYTFVGWTGTGLGKPIKDLVLNAPIAGDLKLTAMWTPIKYKITYKLNGGTVSGAPNSYTIESNGLVIPTPVKPGSDFLGWRINGSESLTGVTTWINKGTMGNKTYTAVWKDYTPQEYAMKILVKWATVRDEDSINGVAFYSEDTSASTPYPSSMWISTGNISFSRIESHIHVDGFMYVVSVRLDCESERFEVSVQKWEDGKDVNRYYGTGYVYSIGKKPDFSLTRNTWTNDFYNMEMRPDEAAMRAIGEQELIRIYNWLNDIYHNRIKSGKYDMSCFGL